MHDLVRAAQGGDPVARDRLIRVLLPSIVVNVMSILYRHGRQSLDADDVVQEVAERVIANLGRLTYQGKAQLAQWIKTITLNTVSGLREFQHAERRDVSRTQPLDSVSAEKYSRRSEGEDGICQKLIRSEEVDRLVRAIGELPDDEADMIRLVYLEELNVAQAARLRDIPETTARSRLNRARTTLGFILRPRTHPK
jgi:RNA polymerase sigma-70 factor (ECF subfamily)